MEEVQSIIAGLKGLSSVSDTSRMEWLISRLAPGGEAVVSITVVMFIMIEYAQKQKEWG